MRGLSFNVKELDHTPALKKGQGILKGLLRDTFIQVHHPLKEEPLSNILHELNQGLFLGNFVGKELQEAQGREPVALNEGPEQGAEEEVHVGSAAFLHGPLVNAVGLIAGLIKDVPANHKGNGAIKGLRDGRGGLVNELELQELAEEFDLLKELGFGDEGGRESGILLTSVQGAGHNSLRDKVVDQLIAVKGQLHGFGRGVE